MAVPAVIAVLLTTGLDMRASPAKADWRNINAGQAAVGSPTNGTSWRPSIAGRGRFVAFISNASNLVAGDTNASSDVFIRDLVRGTIRRINITSAGHQSQGLIDDSSISDDGRYVAFTSAASDLVPGDTNNEVDVFVRDLTRGRTQRVSVSSTGQQSSGGILNLSISGNGRYVAFDTPAALVPEDRNGQYDGYVRDMVRRVTRRVHAAAAGQEDLGNILGRDPAVSDNGRFITFVSRAGLVPDDTNGRADVYVRDVTRGTIKLVSLSSTGTQGNDLSVLPVINDNGRYVVFSSDASNLVPGDTNGNTDVFLRDLVRKTTRRVSLSRAGLQGNADSEWPVVAGNGRYVVFLSYASNMVPGDTNGESDLFVRDLTRNTISRINLSNSGRQANAQTYDAKISDDGRYVAFYSEASNLVPGDTNGAGDVFVRDLIRRTTRLISVGRRG
ncbi:TolB family protein [Krasilnikovia cinnamomea]|nr:PD40 domain-containing protein [Krasilnikovia cinnamomea]